MVPFIGEKEKKAILSQKKTKHINIVKTKVTVVSSLKKKAFL